MRGSVATAAVGRGLLPAPPGSGAPRAGTPLRGCLPGLSGLPGGTLPRRPDFRRRPGGGTSLPGGGLPGLPGGEG